MYLFRGDKRYEVSDDLVFSFLPESETWPVRGQISRCIDYDQSTLIRNFDDGDRTPIQLEPDSVYLVRARGWGGQSEKFFVSTFEGSPDLIFSLAKVFPEGFARVCAEQERKSAEEKRKHEERVKQRDEERRIQERRTKLRRQIDTLALDIYRNKGRQPGGFPSLSGTPKQIAFAIIIRNAVAERTPDHADLRDKKITRATQWINNHIWALEAE